MEGGRLFTAAAVPAVARLAQHSSHVVCTAAIGLLRALLCCEDDRTAADALERITLSTHVRQLLRRAESLETLRLPALHLLSDALCSQSQRPLGWGEQSLHRLATASEVVGFACAVLTETDDLPSDAGTARLRVLTAISRLGHNVRALL